MNTVLAAAYAVIAQQLENLELAALNNSVSWQTRIPSSNIGSKRAIELSLIEKDGSVIGREELITALENEINWRVNNGTFV